MSSLGPGIAITASGLCAGLVVWSLVEMNRSLVEESESQFGNEVNADLGPLKLFLPTGRIGALWARSITGGKRGPALQRMDRLIKHAGQPGGILSEELAGMTLANGLLGAAMMFIFAKIGDVPAHLNLLLLGVVLLMAGLPWFWLMDMRSKRQKAIRKGLPYALDLLTLGVEAGLDFTVAIQRIIDKMGKSPLSQEFRRMLRDLQMGAQRREALQKFRGRIDMPDVNMFVSSLVQADELGSPLGPILKIQSIMLREKRFQRAEEQAMKAPVKIVFPLALFILPVTGLIFLVPLAIKFQESIGSVSP